MQTSFTPFTKHDMKYCCSSSAWKKKKKKKKAATTTLVGNQFS